MASSPKQSVDKEFQNPRFLLSGISSKEDFISFHVTAKQRSVVSLLPQEGQWKGVSIDGYDQDGKLHLVRSLGRTASLDINIYAM